jgi:hypothetical protein
MGKWRVTEQQSKKLGLKKGTRLSPHLEKCCLILSANVSYANTTKDLQQLTGISILRTLFKEGCDAFGKQRLRNTAEK